MDTKDRMKNNDVKYAVNCLEDTLENLKQLREDGHLLSPQYDVLQHDINLLESGIKKINDKWNIK